jgi:flagellin-like protein
LTNVKRRDKMKNKKGVSPLIAAVLLIAFTVAIGAVVMTWGRNYVQSNIDKADTQGTIQSSCSLDAKLNVLNLGTGYEVCYGNGTTTRYGNVTISVQNTGSATLAGYRIVTVLNNGNVFTNDSMTTLVPGDIQRAVFRIDQQVGGVSVRQVSILPYITYSGQSVLCANNKVDVRTVGFCT